MHETLFLTVNIIDRFLAQQTVVRKKLQLVGLVAMLLACKYEEVSVPVVGDLILISDKAYTRDEVLKMVISISFFGIMATSIKPISIAQQGLICSLTLHVSFLDFLEPAFIFNSKV